MQFRVLGPLEVSEGGFVAALSAAKPRSLLAMLLTNPGRVVSADALVDALWGEAPPASAAKLLQVYVSQLRKEIPGIALVTVAPGYRLEVAPDDLDSARFEALAHEGAAALRAGNPLLAARLLARGLALWRGNAYADVTEPFGVAEAARLEALRLDAVQSRIEADLATGSPPEVLVTELRALIDEHPLRERLWALLMRALVAGQQSAVA
ncbi:MAG: hypothetical protein QOK42_2822, partial [Frankiaceae bacterium]|nr:hypothetical protein [Frankiaceae bacterium]